MSTKFMIALLIFTAFSYTATAQLNVERKTISEKKFTRLMDRRNTVILDVRTPGEFAAGHIPGAINIDVQDSSFMEKLVTLDQYKRYLLYCHSGRRSEKALRILYDQGYHRAFHLKGGYEGWKKHH